MSNPAAVIVLAAGAGTRMKSATPKVLHEIGGVSLLGHVVAAARSVASVPGTEVLVVVGHGRDAVMEHLAGLADPPARPVVQAEQHGTGHAVRLALAELPPSTGSVVVIAGDTPLLTGETLAELVEHHDREGNAATVLTADLADPTGYGRILRDDSGAVTGIVEQKDATEAERAVTEINSGMYVFDGTQLRSAITELTRDNAQGEEYLTDVLAILRARGLRIGARCVDDATEVLGVNDRVQLAAAGRLLNDRIVDRWMRAGVTVVDPATTWIEATAVLDQDVTLEPNTQLRGRTTVASGARVGPDTTLVDVEVGERASVVRTHATGAVIGAEAQTGPYSYLRPGTRLGVGAKIGAYVETKNASVGDGSKVPHLSYVGDAEIGVGTNIGAATVFVNYDGVNKHRTVIGDHVRVGSDTMLVAPVTVGDGAYTAAGSVIVDDVPAGAIGVARAVQRNILGWVARRRADTDSARAAAAAQPAGGTDSTDAAESR